jgi:hypothetical protein
MSNTIVLAGMLSRSKDTTTRLHVTRLHHMDERGPLPSSVEYSPFRKSLHHVVANVIPIVDGPNPKQNRVSLIVGLVASFFRIPILGFFLVRLFRLVEWTHCY